MKDKHDKLIAELEEVSPNQFWSEYQPSEHESPQTLIGRIEGKEGVDRNVEVIYLEGVVLLQENGNDNLGRTGFVWLSPNWVAEAVRKYVLEWL